MPTTLSFPCWETTAEFDLASLYVENRVARGALLEDEALCLVPREGAACAHAGEKGVRVEGLLAAFLPVLPLAMVLPIFLILAFVIRVVAFGLSLAGTPPSRGWMAGCPIPDSSILNRRRFSRFSLW